MQILEKTILTLRYNFSSNVSGLINCGMGLGGTIGALALLGCNGGGLSMLDPPGSNADEPSLDSQLVGVLYWAPIFFSRYVGRGGYAVGSG